MGDKTKVLVVDDERDFVENLEDILKQEGFSVVKAYDGNEAVESLRSERPDIVLLDIGMPKQNGFKTCEILRKQGASVPFPIVMLTARNAESDIVEALQSGADDYLSKPFEVKELLAKVKLLLTKARSGKLPSQTAKR